MADLGPEESQNTTTSPHLPSDLSTWVVPDPKLVFHLNLLLEQRIGFDSDTVLVASMPPSPWKVIQHVQLHDFQD